MCVSLEADKIYQWWGQTGKGAETFGMKIVEIIIVFGFELDREKNDDRMLQVNM